MASNCEITDFYLISENISILNIDTYVNVITTDEPQTENELEKNSKRKKDQPWQQPSAGAFFLKKASLEVVLMTILSKQLPDFNAIIHEIRGHDQDQEVNNKNRTKYFH